MCVAQRSQICVQRSGSPNIRSARKILTTGNAASCDRPRSLFPTNSGEHQIASTPPIQRPLNRGRQAFEGETVSSATGSVLKRFSLCAGRLFFWQSKLFRQHHRNVIAYRIYLVAAEHFQATLIVQQLDLPGTLHNQRADSISIPANLLANGHIFLGIPPLCWDASFPRW